MSEKSILKFTLTNRMAKQLIINNYLFYKNQIIEDKTYWQCKESRSILNCKSTCKTTGENETDTIIAGPSEHNHDPLTLDQLKIINFKTAIKKRANEEQTPVPEIYAQELEKMATDKQIDGETLEIPKLRTIKEYLVRSRKRKLNKSIEEIDLEMENQLKNATIEPTSDNIEILKLKKENSDLRSNLEIQALKNENALLRSSMEIQKLQHEKQILEQKIEMQNREIENLRPKLPDTLSILEKTFIN